MVILTSMWDIAKFMTIGFMGIYKTKDLALTVTMVQIIHTAAVVIQVGLTIPIGKYADRTSYARCMELSFFIEAIGFLMCSFTTHDRWWMIIVFTIFYQIGLADISQNVNNMAYSYVKEKYIVYAMVIRNCIGGILGFLSSIFAGVIVEYIQNNDNIIFGMEFYAQQVLAFISFIILIIAILFDRFIVEKQKVIIQ